MIYANYGNTKRIKEHLFPNTKPEIHDKTVDKFVNKYSQWLSNKIDKSEDKEKFINKDVIKNLLTQELVKRKKLKEMVTKRNHQINVNRSKHGSLQSRKNTTMNIKNKAKQMHDLVSLSYFIS